MPAKIVLVTGGARSGKSEFAEKYVLHYGAKCAYPDGTKSDKRLKGRRTDIHAGSKNGYNDVVISLI